MRLALLACSALTLLTLTTLACSGSEEPAPAAEKPAPAAKDTTPSPTPEPAQENTSQDPPPSTDGGATSADGGGGGGDGGGVPMPVGDGGAGSMCVAGSVLETEPNNDMGSATAVPGQTGTLCGRIAAAGDVDFFTFVMPPTAMMFGMNVNMSAPGLKIEPTADGEPFPFNGTYLFKPGKPYVLKVSATVPGPIDYRIGITIN